MLLRTLYTKLLLVFLLFCGAMTVVFLSVLRVSHHQYHLLSDQTANRGLAQQYVDNSFLVSDGPPTASNVHRGIQELATLNRAVDIYLVDAAGGIVASSVDDLQRPQTRIDVDTIGEFLDAEKLPIFGVDPREPEDRKIFSAALVDIPEYPAKYLYVVLRSQDRAAATSLDYSVGENLAGASAVMLFSAAASLVVLRLLTRRLGRLESAMLAFRASNFSQIPLGEPLRAYERGDEIERLSTMFAQLAELIRDQVQELRRTDEMRRDMLTSVSHDLRTPLATIRVQLEAMSLRDSTLSADQRHEYLETSIKQTQRLTRMVDQLLQSASLEAHQVRPEMEPMQLGDLLQDVIQKHEVAAHEGNVGLHGKTTHGLRLVFADAGLIERVLDNLIDNALQYAPAGTAVRIELTVNGDAVRCSVSDTGPGIAESDRLRILEPFYRADRSRSSSAGHAGLGLSIVAAILLLHETILHVESEVGRGATFWFELPSAPAQARKQG